MRYEYEMVESLKRYFSGYAVIEEFDGGHGIADLLVIVPDEENIEARRKAGQLLPLTEKNLVRALALIPYDRPVTLDFLEQVTCLSRRNLKERILKVLADGGYIRELPRGRYVRLGPPIIARELIGIEAKMKNWRRGVLQARRYRQFCHAVYLAIHETAHHRVHIPVLRRQGLGLFVVSNSSVYELVKPRQQCPNSDILFLYSNEVIWERARSAMFDLSALSHHV